MGFDSKNIDRKLIETKLRSLEDYLIRLAEMEDLPFEEYAVDYFRKKGIERVIAGIVECATDINSYLLARGAGISPKDYRDSFTRLIELGILPREFVEKIAASTGLRNRLVHEYDRINDKIVHASIKTTLDQYTHYVKYIHDFLQRFKI